MPRTKRCKLEVADAVVKLNVGGTIFQTLRSTLKNNSTYFSSGFSEEWGQHGSSDNEIFLDHGPDAFKYILSYMRNGFIDVNDLTKEVLLLADYLLVEKLVRAAKILMAKNAGYSAPSEDNMVELFEKKIGPIKDISAENIKRKLREIDPGAPVEYAMLYLHKSDKKIPVSCMYPAFRAGLKISTTRSEIPDFTTGIPQGPACDELSDRGGHFLPVFAL